MVVVQDSGSSLGGGHRGAVLRCRRHHADGFGSGRQGQSVSLYRHHIQVENLGSQNRRRWSQHDSRMDEGGCGFGSEAVNDAKRFWTSIYMYYWDPSGPNRKSCAWASWASGFSPDIPSLLTMTTSDIRSASGAFLVTDGFHSFSVGTMLFVGRARFCTPRKHWASCQ